MIIVKIELWPRGDQERAEEIGRTYIANVGGTSRRGDYRVHVTRRGSPHSTNGTWLAGKASVEPRSGRTGSVDGYPRLAYNVWRLVIRALLACFPEERPRGDKALATSLRRELRAFDKSVPKDVLGELLVEHGVLAERDRRHWT
jgi:hypothetical protein